MAPRPRPNGRAICGKKLLAAYEPPAMDEAVDEALKAYMERRKPSLMAMRRDRAVRSRTARQGCCVTTA